MIKNMLKVAKKKQTMSITYTEIPSSLMIYPIPYPSAATGPNPNNLNAGFPQFDVDKIDVLKVDQPGSVKMEGRAGLWSQPLEQEEAGDVGRLSDFPFPFTDPFPLV